MKKVLAIALTLLCCFAAEAQLPIIKPSWTYKIPNNSNTKSYRNGGDCLNDPLFLDFYSVEEPWRCLGEVGKIVASSTLRPQGSKNYRATNLYDFDHETAWVEGVKGYGIGQWIEYQGVCGNSIESIRILNGYVKSDKAWRENARVKYLKVYCNGKPICIFELKNSRTLQSFNVSKLRGIPYYGIKKTFRFEILDVYPGTKYQDTVISEIYFD